MPNLTADTAESVTRPGLHRAAKRLYLQVSPTGAKSWIFRYSAGGRIRSMGLGPFPDVTISKAKAKADKQNAILADGIDPIAKRDADAAAKAKIAGGTTFREIATAYIAAHTPSWKNTKYATQWTTSLKADVYPRLGDMPVASITVDDVLAVLLPIWTEKHESATRIRSRIAAVLSAAKAKGLRDGPNPAAWADNLKHLLPTISRSRRIVHFRALPYAAVPALMATLRARPGVSALALRFTILTACRTAEMRGATWDEFDLDAKVWTVPGSRIKSGRMHRVPISDEVVAILETVKGLSKKWVFPGRKGKPLSDNALLILLERLELGAKTTTHGFRSAFRMWAAEQTNYPREICEQALAHSTQDEVEAAYMRGDHFNKRTALMRDWAVFLGQQDAVQSPLAAE
jgi:integrase